MIVIACQGFELPEQSYGKGQKQACVVEWMVKATGA
jgi:hypothetical protein